MKEWDSFDKITNGKGIWLIDSKGNKLLDAVGSMWCNVWGHSNTELIKAITNQSKKLQHSSMFNLTNEPAEKLADRLVKISPGMNKVFYSDNGSSAMEIALKLALQYWKNIGWQHPACKIHLLNLYTSEIPQSDTSQFTSSIACSKCRRSTHNALTNCFLFVAL